MPAGGSDFLYSYGNWSPRAQLRLSASNLTARNYLSGLRPISSYSAGQSLSDSTQTKRPKLQAKLELKL